jgi:hypothetical protein
VFTARYALSPYIKQISFVLKGLKRELGWRHSRQNALEKKDFLPLLGIKPRILGHPLRCLITTPITLSPVPCLDPGSVMNVEGRMKGNEHTKLQRGGVTSLSPPPPLDGFTSGSHPTARATSLFPVDKCVLLVYLTVRVWNHYFHAVSVVRVSIAVLTKGTIMPLDQSQHKISELDGFSPSAYTGDQCGPVLISYLSAIMALHTKRRSVIHRIHTRDR